MFFSPGFLGVGVDCLSVDGSCLLSVVGCRLLTIDSKLSLSMVVVGSWLSGVRCRLLKVLVSFFHNRCPALFI
jgi:hypothetical protein